MSESIAEMVIPGTYIEVRAEGLIGVTSPATGNIGVVGTASRGPVGTVVPLGSYAEAIDTFGAYDAFADPVVADTPLTLTRAIEQLYTGGAGSVYAVRIANGDPTFATADVKASGAAEGFTLTAKDAGSWGNTITYTLVDEGVAPAHDWTLTLVAGPTKEVYSGATVGDVHDAIAAAIENKSEKLVTIGAASNTGSGFDTVATATAFSGGTDLPNATSTDVATGLAALAAETVNILVVAGLGSGVIRAVVGGHLEQTENDGRERIAILGATDSDLSAIEGEVADIADKRIVLVAPGMQATDAPSGKSVTLPPPYLAAVVAGKLSTLAPEISLTNQTLPVADLDQHYNSAALKSLLLDRVLLVRPKFGFQIVKGITTDTGAFKQISVRRVVDYAKAGVRSGADPYIGRLNNVRVRAALKATLDGFLSQMVLDEMLVSYKLDVTATRAQEITGIAVVSMTLEPTFSIDYIRVTMTLQ
jgi:Phage tail sheath C-terminal domain